MSTPIDPQTQLIGELTGALRFILAFYDPNQRHLDTNAWKQAEAGGRQALAKGEEYVKANWPD